MLRELGSPIYLAHDDVDRTDDGGDVGDQAVGGDRVGDAEVRETGRPCPHAQGDVFLGVPADDVKAHLTARAFGLDIGLPGGQVLGRLDAVGAGGGGVTTQALLDDLDALHDLDHAHEIPVPAIADLH